MYTVLIVEDEEIVRRGLVLTTHWEAMDLEVVGEASQGQEGLELAKKLNPDIIITDIKMPLMDGLEMIEQLKGDFNGAFIVISAFNEFEYAKQALTLGAVDYLLKPFRDQELKDSITKAKNYLQDQSLLKELSQIDQNQSILKIEESINQTNNSLHQNMKLALEYIRENYSKEITVRSLSEYLRVSESTVNRLFRSESNYSFQEYITMYRIREACKLLDDQNIKIYEVADAVGYSDQRYFSSVFKKYIGQSPKSYRERKRKS